jgi:hypothetical protein
MDDYPLLNLFLTMLWFFLFVAWISLLFRLFADIFRSRDLSGPAKAFWTLFIVVLPWLGALLYLIVRGGSMQERTEADAAQRDEALRAYVRDAAGIEAAGQAPASTADELTKLGELRDAGTLTADEFQTQKARLLA